MKQRNKSKHTITTNVAEPQNLDMQKIIEYLGTSNIQKKLYSYFQPNNYTTVPPTLDVLLAPNHKVKAEFEDILLQHNLRTFWFIFNFDTKRSKPYVFLRGKTKQKAREKLNQPSVLPNTPTGINAIKKRGRHHAT
jgi:hypothetical protein